MPSGSMMDVGVGREGWEQYQLGSVRQSGWETQVRAKVPGRIFWCPPSSSHLALPLSGTEKEPQG